MPTRNQVQVSGTGGGVAVIIGWLISLLDQFLAPRGFGIPPDVQAALTGLAVGYLAVLIHAPTMAQQADFSRDVAAIVARLDQIESLVKTPANAQDGAAKVA